MIGILPTLSGMEDSTLVCQEVTLTTIHTNSNWADITKDKLHVLFVIRSQNSPPFSSGDGTCYLIDLTFLLFAFVRILT